MPSFNCPNCSHPRKNVICGTTVTCVNCGIEYTIPNFGRSCSWCGAQLAESATYCRECGKVVPSETENIPAATDTGVVEVLESEEYDPDEDFDTDEDEPGIDLAAEIVADRFTATEIENRLMRPLTQPEKVAMKRRIDLAGITPNPILWDALAVDESNRRRYKVLITLAFVFWVFVAAVITLSPNSSLAQSEGLTKDELLMVRGLIFLLFVVAMPIATTLGLRILLSVPRGEGERELAEIKRQMYEEQTGFAPPTKNVWLNARVFCPWCRTKLPSLGEACEACDFGNVRNVPEKFIGAAGAELEALGGHLRKPYLGYGVVRISGPDGMLLKGKAFNHAAWAVSGQLKSFSRIAVTYFVNPIKLLIVLLALGGPVLLQYATDVSGEHVMFGLSLAASIPLVMTLMCGQKAAGLGGRSVQGKSINTIRRNRTGSRITEKVFLLPVKVDERVRSMQRAVKWKKLARHGLFWTIVMALSTAVWMGLT